MWLQHVRSTLLQGVGPRQPANMWGAVPQHHQAIPLAQAQHLSAMAQAAANARAQAQATQLKDGVARLGPFNFGHHNYQDPRGYGILIAACSSSNCVHPADTHKFFNAPYTVPHMMLCMHHQPYRRLSAYKTNNSLFSVQAISSSCSTVSCSASSPSCTAGTSWLCHTSTTPSYTSAQPFHCKTHKPCPSCLLRASNPSSTAIWLTHPQAARLRVADPPVSAFGVPDPGLTAIQVPVGWGCSHTAFDWCPHGRPSCSKWNKLYCCSTTPAEYRPAFSGHANTHSCKCRQALLTLLQCCYLSHATYVLKLLCVHARKLNRDCKATTCVPIYCVIELLRVFYCFLKWVSDHACCLCIVCTGSKRSIKIGKQVDNFI